MTDITIHKERHERLKTILSKVGYPTLERATGISTRTLARMKNQNPDPKFSQMVAICEAAGVDLNWVAHGDVRNRIGTELTYARNDNQAYLINNVGQLNDKQLANLRMIAEAFIHSNL